MHLVELLIDKRTPCRFISSEEVENIIFCRPFEESLHDVVDIITKDNGFIHKVVTEASSTYINTDVVLPSGEVLDNVRFKLIACDSDELPYSTVNLSNNTTSITESIASDDYRNDEITDIESVLDDSTSLIEEQVEQEIELEQSEIELTDDLFDELNVHLVELLLDKRIPFKFIDSASVENIIFCRPFEETLHGAINITAKDKEFIHGVIAESTGTYINTSIVLPTGEIIDDVKFRLVACESDRLPYSTINLSKYTAPIVGYPIYTPSEQPQDILVEKIEDPQIITEEVIADIPLKPDFLKEAKLVQERLYKQQEDLKRKESELRAMTNYFNKLIKEHKENLDDTANEKITKLNTVVEDLDLENLVSKVDELIEERRNNETAKQYADKAIAAAVAEMKNYARRLMDLVGGGGSVAQQFAAGGTMNGNLNVTGQYLSGGITLSSILTGGGGGVDAQVTTISNTVTATDNFIVFNIGGLPRAVQIWNY